MIHRCAAFLVLFLLACPPASAVFDLKVTVDKTFEGSGNVVVGTITKCNPEAGTVEAQVKALKGKALGEVIRIKIEGLPEVTGKLKVGGAVVMMIARFEEANSALHLADTWLLPVRVGSGKPALFSVRQTKDLRVTFPGTTAALVSVVEEIAGGKSPLLNKASPDIFKGGVKELGVLGSASSLMVGGKAADGKPMLLSFGADGAKAYALTDSAANAAGMDTIVAGSISLPPADEVAGAGVLDLNGDGKADLAIVKKNGELLVFENGGVARPARKLWEDGGTAVAAAFGDFSADNRPAVLVVKPDGIVRYGLDAAAEPGDFMRLTGEDLKTYNQGKSDWLAGSTVAAIDYNGDGRIDLLVNAPSRQFLLINRGYGTFFINPDLAKVLVDSTGALLKAGTVIAGVDMTDDGLGDLVMVGDKGQLRAIIGTKSKD